MLLLFPGSQFNTQYLPEYVYGWTKEATQVDRLARGGGAEGAPAF